MAKGHRPPPLTLAPPPAARTKIAIHPRQDYIPAYDNANRVSVFEDDADEERPPTFLIAVRIMNDIMHIVGSLFILLIMGFFVNKADSVNDTTAHAAIAIIVFASFDMMLDFRSLSHYERSWEFISLLFRLALGVGYLAIFAIYIILGRAFPLGYEFWGLSQPWTWYMVYLFQCLLGVWNLGFVLAYRSQFFAGISRLAGLCCGSARRGRGRGPSDVEAGYGRRVAGNASSIGSGSTHHKAASVASSMR